MLDTINLWLRKAAFVSGVLILTTVSTSASAADTCTSIVGNLMTPNNCGFDSGVTSPWTVVGTNGSLSIASVAASPSGNPYMVVTPNANSIYSIKSGTFNIQTGIV